MSSRGRTLRLRVLGILAFAVVAAVVFVYFLSLSGVDLLPHDTYTITATADNVVSLSDHADVLEAGIKVGTVSGIAPAGPAGGQTRVTLTLDRRYGPVYRDGQILIRAKTLAGENYVDLDPGAPTSGAVRNGGTLPSPSSEPTQLDQILSTFDAKRRRDLQRLLDVLGVGLGGHGPALGQTLAASADLVNKTTPVADVLSADRQQLASLIDDFGLVSSALGQRAGDIRRLVTTARVASSSVAARDADVEATFRILPRFLAQARTTVTDLGAFSGRATPVVSNLRQATGALIPAIHALQPASAQLRHIFAALGPFADATVPVARNLRSFSPAARATMGPFEGVLRQANPLLSYLAPYSLELGSLFQSMEEAAHYRDGSAGYGRVAGIVSDNLVTGVSPGEDQLVLALEHAGLLTPLAIKHYNAYPRPRTAAHPVPFAGAYPHIEADPPYKLRS